MNLPPFYIGQKVVCLKGAGKIVKDQIYTVADCFQCQVCKEWHVQFSELPTGRPDYHCCEVIKSSQHLGGPAKYFAPIQENFQSISLEKILEEETELISVN